MFEEHELSLQRKETVAIYPIEKTSEGDIRIPLSYKEEIVDVQSNRLYCEDCKHFITTPGSLMEHGVDPDWEEVP